jgi:hypothetical protein
MRVEVAPPVQAGDVENIGQAATRIGFVFQGGNNTDTVLPAGPATAMMSWEWPAHKTVHTALLKIQRTNSYWVLFSDNRPEGGDVIGPPCEKYLEFVAALNQRLGKDQSRLTFSPASCDPNGLDPYGKPYHD